MEFAAQHWRVELHTFWTSPDDAARSELVFFTIPGGSLVHRIFAGDPFAAERLLQIARRELLTTTRTDYAREWAIPNTEI